MKRTYYVQLELGKSLKTGDELWALATFNQLWKAVKFARAFESHHVPSLIIDATALTNANT